MTFDLTEEDARWGERDLATLVETALTALFQHRHIPSTAEISILATNDARIATLNAEFRDKSASTNVLSWPSAEFPERQPATHPASPKPDPFGELSLGDLALAFETCAAEAEAASIPFEHHVTHLIVHGTLHLLGYDHINSADGDLMEKIEVEVLASLGIANPY